MPRSASGPAIEIDQLTIRYGEHVAVDAVSLQVEPGEVFALLGPNGAGKTSTVETLEGYRRPDGGQVRVLGLDPVADHGELTTLIGVMLQQGGVYTAARPDEVLRLFAAYYDHPDDPDELLHRVGLADRRRSTWKSLSGGEQQRLSLALALIGRPQVAFLDEPTAGIDPSGRQLIRRVIAELRDQGVTVLLTTHDLDEAEKLADRVAIIDHGHVLAVGSPAELMTGGDHEQINFGAPRGLDTAALGAHLGHDVTEVAPGEYQIDAPPAPATIAALTAWLAERDVPLGDLRAGRQRLEDVFLRLTAAAALEVPRDEPTAGRRRRGRRAGRPSSGSPSGPSGGSPT